MEIFFTPPEYDDYVEWLINTLIQKGLLNPDDKKLALDFIGNYADRGRKAGLSEYVSKKIPSVYFSKKRDYTKVPDTRLF